MGRLDTLWEYQLAEQKKSSVEREITNTPARVRFTKLHAFLSEQQKLLNRLQEEIEQHTAQLTRLDEKVKGLEKDVELELSEFAQMQNDAECTPEEYTECRRNMEALLNTLNDTRKELQDLTKKDGQTVQTYKSTRSKAVKAKKEYDELRIVCEGELAGRKDELDECDREIDRCGKAVEPALLTRYRKIRKNYQDPVAVVANNQCGGCNMSLPMAVVKRVAAGVDVVECENCGRILYTK